MTLHVLAVILFSLAFCAISLAQEKLDRTVLPIPEPKPPVYTELDRRNDLK